MSNMGLHNYLCLKDDKRCTNFNTHKNCMKKKEKKKIKVNMFFLADLLLKYGP